MQAVDHKVDRRQKTEIEAIWVKEIFRREEWVVGEARLPRTDDGQGTLGFDDRLITVTVLDPNYELETGLNFRFMGKFTFNPKYGEQFDCKSFVLSKPLGKAGIVKYLQRCSGIGPATAHRLYELYAGNAIEVLKRDPAKASAAIGHFPLAQAIEASEQLIAQEHLEKCFVEIYNLLDGRGFPKTLPKRCIEVWGNRAPKLIERNPFLLMRFASCGFGLCHKMYLALGGSPFRLKIQALCIWAMIQADNEGHTWFPISMVRGWLEQKIAGTFARPVDAIKVGIKAPKRNPLLRVIRKKGDDLPWISDGRSARAEAIIARGYLDSLNETPEWPELPADCGASEHQIAEWDKARQGVICGLGGTPGTGKTWLAAQIIKAICETHGLAEIAVAAPTGKAAVRLTELMFRAGVGIVATTIHSMLGVAKREEGEGWSFAHGRNNPLPFTFIVLDESSMDDVSIAASVFDARGEGTHIIFIGDIGQLPPVGPGAPFRDLIAANMSYGELTEIHRQDQTSTIVQVCRDIRYRGQFWNNQTLDPKNGINHKLFEAKDPTESRDKILELVQNIAGTRFDAIRDVQILCALNEDTPTSRAELNRVLQNYLNPKGQPVGKTKFRVGDKVVCLKNCRVSAVGAQLVIAESLQYFKLRWPVERKDLLAAYRQKAKETHPDAGGNEKAFVEVQRHFERATELLECGYQPSKQTVQVRVANGEVGYVIECNEEYMICRFDYPERTIQIPLRRANADDKDDGSLLSNFEMGYAITCHKFQGSQAPFIIIAVEESRAANLVCSREWLYTAMSRAEYCCMLVGKMANVEGMCRRVALANRKTLLKEMILGEVEI